MKNISVIIVTYNGMKWIQKCLESVLNSSVICEITVIDNNSTDETTFITFTDGATGAQGIETDTGLTYNPSSGVLTSTTFVGALTGNASTATTLASNRNFSSSEKHDFYLAKKENDRQIVAIENGQA